jgi:hypothetical protein
VNKVVLVLIGIVLLGIAGFATLWFKVGSELQDKAAAILVDCREGRSAEVYAAASAAFREGWTQTQFDGYLAYWHARRGAFKSVTGRTNVSTHSGGGSTTKTVTLKLEYERDTAEGFFAFEVEGDELRLRHLSIRPTERAVDRSDRGALDVIADHLFKYYNGKEYVALYAKLSPKLQMAWPPGVMGAELEKLHAMVGPMDLNVERREVSEKDDIATAVYDVRFEKSKGVAKIDFEWTRDHWRVVSFLLKTGS